jgi:aryl-alcohol dehydrogenase-like predicted oxidoreductase
MLDNIKIGLGTGALGGHLEPDFTSGKNIERIVKHALDIGVKLFDTASSYGGGYTEEILGKALGSRRGEAIIATKFGVECKTGSGVRISLEGSLRRLGTDYIDLYQNHWTSSEVDFQGMLSEMQALVGEGKVRRIGLCNLPLKNIKLAMDILGEDFVSVQDEYNLLERSSELTIQPFCRENNLSFLAYSPFLRGRSLQAHSSYKRLQEIAQELNFTVHALTLNWLASRANVIVIPRTNSLEHLSENVSSVAKGLQAEVMDEIDALFKPNVVKVLPSSIVVVDADDRSVYKNLEEALRNELNLVPSPLQMSEHFLGGEVPKPLKLRRISDGTYALVEGRLKYWGWVIAFGPDSLPINAIIED